SCRRPTVESAVYAGSEAGTYAVHWERARCSTRSQLRDCRQDPVDLHVLGFHVLLDLEGSVQHGVGILVGRLRPRISRGALYVLADDDDREQNELEKGLRDPRDRR